MEEEVRNLGVILGQRDTDWVAGTIPYEVNVPDGDWTPYLPPGEWQRVENLDLMSCVTFSALNVIETLYKFQIGESRNFSDRFTARMSGTTPQGNWLWKVADSIRKDGVVDEADWPIPANTTWEGYYTTPPYSVIDKAQRFLNKFKVNYEVVDFTKESLMHHLKQSPIQVVIPGHAVMNFFTNADIYKYFDSYEPFIKERKDGFVSALKYVMVKNEDMLFEQIKTASSPDVYLVRDGKKTLVRNQNVIKIVGDFSKVVVVTQEELEAIPDENFGLLGQGGGSIGWEPVG